MTRAVKQDLVEKSYALRTVRHASSRSVPESIIVELSGDHFQPQNRLAFAPQDRMHSELKPDCSKALMLRFSAKFSRAPLQSAIYGDVEV